MNNILNQNLFENKKSKKDFALMGDVILNLDKKDFVINGDCDALKENFQSDSYTSFLKI